jgi:ABC-type multidrug transport system ATPase subunit
LIALYDLIEQKRRAGATIFFSSHQLGDVERLADFVGVLVKGRLASMMSERALAERLADRGVMRVRLRARVAGLLEDVRRLSPGAYWKDEELIVPGSAATRPAQLDRIRTAGGEITSLTAEEGRLDAFYRELVESHP